MIDDGRGRCDSNVYRAVEDSAITGRTPAVPFVTFAHSGCLPLGFSLGRAGVATTGGKTGLPITAQKIRFSICTGGVIAGDAAIVREFPSG